MINNGIKIKDNYFNNRLVIQPMEGADGMLNGAIGELTYRRYCRFAASGAGLIWFEAVSICYEGRANPRQLFLTNENKNTYKNLISEMKSISRKKFGYEPKIIVQLTHSGRQSIPDDTPKPIVAYRNSFLEQGKEDYDYMVASDDYLDLLPNMYEQSAKLAIEVGFDGVDIKCCHGYLLSELMSAYNRTGKYGGDFSKRAKLFIDCVDAVKKVLPADYILASRINASDCYEYPNGYGINKDGEIDLSECKKLLYILKDKELDIVNITLGNPYLIPHINRPCINSPENMTIGLERFKRVMIELKKATDIKLVASALTPKNSNCIEYCNELLEEKTCDFVGFGRMAFAYPDFYVDYLKNGQLDKDKCCIMCAKCTQLMRNGTVSGCPVRDSKVYLPYYRKYVLNQEVIIC